MWWTITGNFGNVLPIDWSKTYARELQEKSLNLGERKVFKIILLITLSLSPKLLLTLFIFSKYENKKISNKLSNQCNIFPSLVDF